MNIFQKQSPPQDAPGSSASHRSPLTEGISVRGLTKSFGRSRVVDGLDFDVTPRHVTGFLGPNGAGKSTTLQMILGLTTPDSGTALIGGRRLAEHSAPAVAAGSLLTTERMPPGLTAEAHLDAIARISGISAAPRPTNLRAPRPCGPCLRAEEAHRPPLPRHAARLGLAAAVLADPEVLILDEPLNGLDPEGITWSRTFLQDFAATGRTVFFSSHLLSEMELTADHVIIIGRGRLVADVALDELRSHTHRGVSVTGPELDPLIASQRAAGRTVTVTDGGTTALIAGARPRDVHRDSIRLEIELDEPRTVDPGLEDIFLQLTNRTEPATEES
ncbi:ATP-binding cassette domain-containing protein [Brevibacterium casei]|nr:ATP-binding cassette domain-containing protein [Brevibacterium casei]